MRLAMIPLPGRRFPRGQVICSSAGLIASLHVLSAISSPIEVVGHRKVICRQDFKRIVAIPAEDAAIIPREGAAVASIRECECGSDVRDVRVEFLWPGPLGHVIYNAWPTRVRRLVRVERYSYTAGAAHVTVADAGIAFLALPGRPGLSGAPVTCVCGGLLGLLHGNVEMNGNRAVCLVSNSAAKSDRNPRNRTQGML